MAFTLITGGRIPDPARRVAEPRDVLVEDDTIREIGPPGLAAPSAATRIDATNRLLIPGLINAHTHSTGNLTRSWKDHWTLELQLSGGGAMRGNMTLENKYLSALLGAIEMVQKGTTACYDLFYEFPVPTIEGLSAVAQAYSDVGMRAVIAPMLADISFYEAIPGLLDAFDPDTRARLAGAQQTPFATHLAITADALRQWQFDRGRVTLALAPTIPMHCTDPFLARSADFCREAGIGFHTHLAESRVQAVYGRQRYGMTLTAHLDRLGVLGPNFTGAHGVWLDDDDVRRLADHGSAIAHNPGSNMRLGAGIAATRRMLDRGLTVGVGTDSRVCSDNLNMFEAMRLAAYVARVQGPDHTRWLDATEAFRMATEGSARALGFGDRLGRLEAGRQADIVFLDLDDPNLVPLNDVMQQLVFAEDGSAVDRVMIAGRTVVEGGKVTTVETRGLAAKAQAAIDRMRALNTEAAAAAAALEPVVGSFCGGLAHAPYHIERFTGGDRG